MADWKPLSKEAPPTPEQPRREGRAGCWKGASGAFSVVWTAGSLVLFVYGGRIVAASEGWATHPESGGEFVFGSAAWIAGGLALTIGFLGLLPAAIALLVFAAKAWKKLRARGDGLAPRPSHPRSGPAPLTPCQLGSMLPEFLA